MRNDSAEIETLDALAAAAESEIGGLRTRVLRRANGALPYDYIVPNGVYEELWDWDAFFVGLHLISENTSDGIYLKNFISWNLLVAQMIEEARSRVFKPDPGQSLWRD